MPVQVKLQGLDRTILNAFKRTKTTASVLNDIGDFVVKDIQRITRTGKSIPDNAKFAPLSRSWKQRRKRLATVNSTSSTYSPARSNLNFTGQLVDSIEFKINQSEGSITIEPQGTRTPYKGIRKSSLKGERSNKKLALFLAQRGRRFLGLSDLARKTIIRKLKSALRRAL